MGQRDSILIKDIGGKIMVACFELMPETVFGKTLFEVLLKFVQYQFSRLHYICISNYTNMFCMISSSIMTQEYRRFKKKISTVFTVSHHTF